MIHEIIIGYVISACLLVVIIDLVSEYKNKKINQNLLENNLYRESQLKVLTQEQIDDIYSRGKITPAKKVKEWEGLDLCAPGDTIGSASWRCKKFKNCHDCLVDYANEHDEYTSFYDILKVVHNK